MAFVWRILPVANMGAGFVAMGIETHTPLPPTKPIMISDYGWVSGSNVVQHKATIECVASGAASAIYVKNLEDLQQKKA